MNITAETSGDTLTVKLDGLLKPPDGPVARC